MYKKKNCVQCGKSHKNLRFCSCHCSVKYNNLQREPTKNCACCEKPMKGRNKYCKDCYDSELYKEWRRKL